MRCPGTVRLILVMLLVGFGGCASVTNPALPKSTGSLFNLTDKNSLLEMPAAGRPDNSKIPEEVKQNQPTYGKQGTDSKLQTLQPLDPQSASAIVEQLSLPSAEHSNDSRYGQGLLDAEASDANWATSFDSETQVELSGIPPNTALRDFSWPELARYRFEAVSSDYKYFYGRTNLVNLATGFLAGAVFANTNFDESISHDFFAENFVDIANEDVTQKLHQFKALGDGYFILPAIGLTAMAQQWLETHHWCQPLGEWGDRSFRAALLGGPLVLVMQNLTGGSRPNESSSLSHWEPFQDNNGVSGHAFIGAVPFLAAARMTENRWARAGLVAVSMMPAISRINDERHYFSQVFLGWYVAYLATRAVDQTQTARPGFQIFPTWDQNGFGLQFEKRF